MSKKEVIMVSFIDIIFLAIAVVFIATRLYGIFGTRGNEKKVRVIIKSLDGESEDKLAENIAQIIKENDVIGENKDVCFDNLSEQDKILSQIKGFDKTTCKALVGCLNWC